MTVEKIDNRPAILPLVLWPGASPIYVPRDEVEDISALLKGERALVREPGEPDIRRVLDLGANVGEFALWCRLRWPSAWVDCVVANLAAEDICALNVPDGARVLRTLSEYEESYDLIRVSNEDFIIPFHLMDHVKIVFFDGVRRDLPDPFVLAATGMRSRGKPYSWWVRSNVRS